MEKMANWFFGKNSGQAWLNRKFSILNFELSIVESFLILFTLVFSAFLRLYRISDYMTFLGDEGRDVMVAKGILEGNFTLLGPRASAGDFFLGPVYYYMIAPFLWLSRFDPVGPAIMVALFGIATVFLVYYVGKMFFGTKAGIMSAMLYAVSPLVIAYSRSSWNPNLMPFVSLLSLYLLYLAVKRNNLKLLLIVGFLLGIAMQLHYLTTFLGVIVFIFVLIGNLIQGKKNILTNYTKQYLSLFVGFVAGLSPFLLFELRHNFANFRTIFNFIFVDSGTKGYPPQESFTTHITDTFFRLFGRLVTTFPPPEKIEAQMVANIEIWQLGTLLLAVTSIVLLFFIKDRLKLLLLVLWLFFGVVLFGFYKKSIYDYYLGFMFPLPFLLVGNLLSTIWNNKLLRLKSQSILVEKFVARSHPRNELRGINAHNKKLKFVGIFVSVLIFTILMTLNLSGNPFRTQPNKQKDQAKNIAEFVLSQTDGKPFNFALITGGNSDHLYRYFFEIEGHSPVTIQNPIIDPDRTSVTDQLLVICEQQDCQPLGNSLWEVAGFGRAEIAGKWDLVVVKVYKLIPYKEK